MSKIKAILIEIDGEEKRLTVEDAKALHEALGELVGETPIPIVINQPYPNWVWNHRTWCNTSPQVNTSMMVNNVSDNISLSAAVE